MNPHSFDVLEYTRVVELVRGKCLSPLGAALAERMTPLSALETVRDRQARLGEMLGLLQRKGNVPCGGAVDVEPLLSRAAAEGSFLEAEDLLHVLRMARMADDVARYFQDEKGACPKLAAIAGGLDALAPLQMEIARCIDDEGMVTDRASGELAAIRREIESTREEVRRVLDRYLQSRRVQRSLQENIVTLRNGRYVLPVKEGDRGAVEGIVHDHSGSGATVFVEPMETVEKNNSLSRLHREELREVRRILRKLTGGVRESAGTLSRNGGILGEIDFIQAKGLFARETDSRIPRIDRDGPIRIVRGRHPLLERSLRKAGEGAALVPLDLEFPDDGRTMVLTGPNTGGKTVALKTVGLFVLMAQAGLGLPAGEGTGLPFFRKVFADIGDEQSIDNSLSSFSARLRQMVRILEEAGDDSLVLIDEVGSGTDPAEGAALAMSVLEEVHRRGAVSLVTTHLGSLKVFVHDRPGMVNASMEFDPNALCPTYRLEVGLPGTSHALEIAARLGVPHAVIERARESMGESEAEIESLLADLKERRLRAAELESDLASERERFRALRETTEEEDRRLREERRAWERERTAEAKRYLDDSRSLVERLVRDLRSRDGDGESIRETRRAIEEERRRLADRLGELAGMEGGRGGGAEVGVGDPVHVKSLNRDGRVVGTGNRPGRVFVEAEGIRLEIAVEDLGPPSGRRPSAGARRRGTPAGGERPLPEGRHELDLRGFRVEEARAALDRFIDEALLSGAPSVRIVHGIGTGAVRSQVTEMLRDDPRIGGFRLGENGGYTLVEM
ncbi:MAG: endonuclease MutS2 [Candidatus Eisenbacteria bacterium]